MPARDANDATWYLLRYARDFAPRPAGPDAAAGPRLDPTLFHDERRHVLELLPIAPDPDREGALLPGLALDAAGEAYRVDPDSGRLVRRRCDGSEVPFPCEPGILAGPRGLALDRRGLLLVADARARRVVALSPEDGTVRAVLNGGALEEPVDVAAAPSGQIYVCDRAGGRIVVYGARFARAGAFPARNAAGLPHDPRPIAIAVDEDGSLLVADARHPRLLRFHPSGEPLADVELAERIAPEDAALEPGALAAGRLPRAIAAWCTTAGRAFDPGTLLARLHRRLRLLQLRLARSFAPAGTFVSAILDGGAFGTAWHRVEVDAEVPPGTVLTVETATADDAALLDPAVAPWTAPRRPDGAIVPIAADLNDQLIQSPPGRYLRLRVAFGSDGSATPRLAALRVLYPRVRYLDLLPRAYRADAESALFLERFLALFERTFTRVEDRYEQFSRDLNSAAAPREVIDWLACLVDLAFDPSWSLERRRALVGEAMALYRARGTVEGLKRYVEIYTGTRPEILETFLERPAAPPYLGRRGNVLGCGLALRPCAEDLPADEALWRDHAHRFTVLVYLDDACEAAVLVPVVDRIVQVNKPAHTAHALCVVRPEATVGLSSRVGLDLVLGGREPGRFELAGGRAPAAPATANVLGSDTVLGRARPYAARLDHPLP